MRAIDSCWALRVSKSGLFAEQIEATESSHVAFGLIHIKEPETNSKAALADMRRRQSEGEEVREFVLRRPLSCEQVREHTSSTGANLQASSGSHCVGDRAGSRLFIMFEQPLTASHSWLTDALFEPRERPRQTPDVKTV